MVVENGGAALLLQQRADSVEEEVRAATMRRS